MTASPIIAKEKRIRLIAVNQVLNVIRGKGYEPSPAMRAAYDRYINGEIEWDMCKELVKKIAAKESQQNKSISGK